jgi:flavodoxin-like protein
MTKLLYVKASPRGTGSRSVAVADSYVAALRAKQHDLVVDTIDLWEENLPPFDGDRANAKLAVITKEPHSASQKTAWDEIVAIASRFTSADRYVFAVPMWNGGIPYRLKQYIRHHPSTRSDVRIGSDQRIFRTTQEQEGDPGFDQWRLCPAFSFARLRCRSSLYLLAILAQSGRHNRHRGDSVSADAAHAGSRGWLRAGQVRGYQPRGGEIKVTKRPARRRS